MPCVCREDGRVRVVRTVTIGSDISTTVGGIRSRPTWTRFQVGRVGRRQYVDEQSEYAVTLFGADIARNEMVWKKQNSRVKQHENPTDETLSLISPSLSSRATAKRISVHMWNILSCPCTRISRAQYSRRRVRVIVFVVVQRFDAPPIAPRLAVLKSFNAWSQLSVYICPPADLLIPNHYLVYTYTLSYHRNLTQYSFWLVPSYRFPPLLLFHPSYGYFVVVSSRNTFLTTQIWNITITLPLRQWRIQGEF